MLIIISFISSRDKDYGSFIKGIVHGLRGLPGPIMVISPATITHGYDVSVIGIYRCLNGIGHGIKRSTTCGIIANLEKYKVSIWCHPFILVGGSC